ncbi:hypothetical protein WD019_16305 [Fictibacillus sp. Mic-4]|uniref:hypothetical protein n=1 Tax=Fictibacillus TaxID=1329200 RepID=UPI0003F7F885|nr:hypothetical protein [Fictibacillus gelatini]
MIAYEYDQNDLSIKEQMNGDDFEFFMKAKTEEVVRKLHEIRDFFDKNDTYTDVLFYPYPDHEYQMIVRKDFYVDFLVSLFKHQLLTSLTWK